MATRQARVLGGAHFDKVVASDPAAAPLPTDSEAGAPTPVAPTRPSSVRPHPRTSPAFGAQLQPGEGRRSFRLGLGLALTVAALVGLGVLLWLWGR